MISRTLLSGLVLLAVPGVARAQDCADLVAAVDQVSAALATVELEQAQVLADGALQQLECQPEPINPLVLASLFQLAGAVSLYMGSQTDAEQAFARAVAASATTPVDPMFGDDVQQIYLEVKRRVLEEPAGSLTVRGQVEAWLDGRPLQVGLPVDVTVGHHLLQWSEGEEPLQGREIRVAAMEARLLTLGEAPQESGRHERLDLQVDTGGGAPRTAFWIGGGAGVLAGGVLLGLAVGTQTAFYREEDPDRLETIQGRNHAFIISGLGLGVAGAGVLGASFLVDGTPGVRVGWQF